MHSWQHDPSMAVPAAHFAASGTLPFDAAPLRRPLESADAVSIGGRHVEASFSGRGIRTITIDGTEAIRDLHIIHATPRASALTSIGVERISDAPDAVQITERFIVFPEIAAFVAEWSCTAQRGIAVEWLHDMHGPARWNTSADALLVSGASASVCIAFANTSVEWEIEEVMNAGASMLRVRARITAMPGGTFLHATSSRLSAGIPPILRSVADTPARARALIGSQRRRAQESLSLASPDPARDDALAWAVQSIAVPRPYADGGATHPVLHALAACAAGSADIARAVIASLHDRDPFLPLLIARYHAWTADSAFVASQWNRTQEAVARLLDAGPDTPAQAALAVAALSEIAATAGDIGRAILPTDLQARVKEFRIAHAAVLTESHWADALDHVEAGVLKGGHNDSGAFATVSAAAVIADVAYGIWGIEPEASRNRVRFRTHLPAAWENASVRGVSVGDASIQLGYSRATDRNRTVHTFVAVQDTGPVPMRLILEPLIEAARVHEAMVDGVPARLDVRAEAGRLLVPVQLVLDDTRVLEVLTEP
jgi:hypothetical protein